MIGTRPRSGENKPAAAMVLSTREWKHTVGGGAEVSPGGSSKDQDSFGVRVGKGVKTRRARGEGQDLGRRGPRGHVYSKMG